MNQVYFENMNVEFKPIAQEIVLGVVRSRLHILTEEGYHMIVNINDGSPTYSKLVDTIVSYKYPSDKMQAIINNYLLDSDDEEIKKEFQDMQAYRKWAKEKAKEALEYARENNLLWEPESNNNEKETD